MVWVTICRGQPLSTPYTTCCPRHIYGVGICRGYTWVLPMLHSSLWRPLRSGEKVCWPTSCWKSSVGARRLLRIWFPYMISVYEVHMLFSSMIIYGSVYDHMRKSHVEYLFACGVHMWNFPHMSPHVDLFSLVMPTSHSTLKLQTRFSRCVNHR